MARACPHCGIRHPPAITRCPATGFPIGGDPGLVGTTIAGRYHLVRLLGDGGMGAVYKAADQVLRRFVAIKLLHANVARNPSSVERFQREARAAAAIGHPNIIDILDFGLEEKRPYMVMEYLRGRSLSQILASDGALPISNACVIATHTLAGLAAAHDRGILHRDLKPANLMLVARFGDRNFIKVCDFGFAALFGGGGSREESKTLTPERTLVGTPAYAAPERLRGDDRRDRRTDVYSVGVVLFEMLAGRRPFDAPTFAELARKVRNEPPPSLRKIRSDIPEGLERAVARALAKAPADRWPSAEALAAALVPYGGRSIAIEEDAPSDSFAFEMMRLRARETKKREQRGDTTRVLTGAQARVDPRPLGEPKAPPPLDEAEPPSVDIPIEIDVPQGGTDVTIRTVPLSEGEALRAQQAIGPDFHDSAGTNARTAVRERDARDLGAPNGVAIAPLRASFPREPSGVRVAGRIVLPVLRFVARRFGERKLKELLETLPPDVRAPFYEGVQPDGWVALEVLLALAERIDAMLGQDDLHLVLESGRAAAEGAFETLQRLRPASPSPELLVAEIPALMRHFYAGLQFHVRRLGKGYGRLELVETATPSLTASVLVLGFVERMLQRFGADEVEVNLLGARALDDPNTLIEVSWLGRP